MARRHRHHKQRKVVRDIYDGKIINDKEAVSLRNIDLVKEKEGLEKPIKKLIPLIFMFLIFSGLTIGVNESNYTYVDLNILDEVDLNIINENTNNFVCRTTGNLCVNINNSFNLSILLIGFILCLLISLLFAYMGIGIFNILFALLTFILALILFVSGYYFIITIVLIGIALTNFFMGDIR